MTNVKGFNPDSGSAPQVSDRSAADRAAFEAASHVRIPTARPAAGGYTRASLTTAMLQAASDEPRPYDRERLGWQYDGLQADNAFGGAA